MFIEKRLEIKKISQMQTSKITWSTAVEVSVHFRPDGPIGQAIHPPPGDVMCSNESPKGEKQHHDPVMIFNHPNIFWFDRDAQKPTIPRREAFSAGPKNNPPTVCLCNGLHCRFPPSIFQAHIFHLTATQVGCFAETFEWFQQVPGKSVCFSSKWNRSF